MVSKKIGTCLINRYLLKQILALQTAATLEAAAVILVVYVNESKGFLFASLIVVPCTSRDNRLNPNLPVTPKQLHEQGGEMPN